MTVQTVRAAVQSGTALIPARLSIPYLNDPVAKPVVHIISAHDAPASLTALGLRDTIPTGKGYAPPVTTKAALPDMILTGDCNPLEDSTGNWLRDRDSKSLCASMVQQARYNHLLTKSRKGVSLVLHADAAQHKCDLFSVFKTATGRLVTIEAPDLVQPADEVPVFEFGGVFTPYADGGAYVIDPTLVADPYLGFSDEEMDTVVWVEGQQFGITLSPEVSILSEMLPNFAFHMVDGLPVADCVANVLDTKTARLRQCAGIVSFREFAMQSRSERENMEAYVLLLADHRVEYHDHVTHEDMCVHGERNYVASISRATGQPFAAKFCKRGQSKTACDPIWVNTDSLAKRDGGAFGISRDLIAAL